MSSALLIAAVTAAIKVATPAPASPHPRVSIAAVPAWVDVIALDPGAAGPTSAEGGHFTELSDHQTHVDPGDGQVVRFAREVERVVTASGIDAAARVELLFDPEYQRLELVHLHVVRAGQVIDALRLGELKVLQRESDLERQIYDGRLSVVAFVPDVRVGDRIDVAYTVRGDNPVLAGHFEDNVDLSPRRPIGRLRERFLIPQSRHVEVRTHEDAPAPTVTERGPLREYVWDLAHAGDDGDPGGATPSGPWAQLGEFASWDEVIHWALPMYQAVAGGGVLAKVAEWRKLPTREAQVAAAVRFVQDEVRYLGFEMGPGSHQPRPPEQTLERRFGDCKDKSLLLATALRELGVPAAPALVAPDWGARLDGLRASPYAFDHVIVRAELDGQVLWIDPTLTYQRGPLAQLTPPYQRALVVDPDQHTLIAIPPAPRDGSPDVAVKERYIQASDDMSVAVEIDTVYRRGAADVLRAALAASNHDTLAEQWRQRRADREPTLVLVGGMKFEDDEAGNIVTTHERYRIPQFWKDGDHDFAVGVIIDALEAIAPGPRRTPLSIQYPVDIVFDSIIQVPERHTWKRGGKTQSSTIISPAFRLDAEIKAERTLRALHHHFHFQTTSAEVAVAQLEEHRVAIERARGWLYHGVHQVLPSEKGDDDGQGAGGKFNRLLILAGVMVVMVLGIVLLTRRRRLRVGVAAAPGRWQAPPARKPKPDWAPGESPATAVALAAGADPAQLVRDRKCSCGEALDASALETSTLSLGGRELSVLRAPCTVCSKRAAIYYYTSGA